MVKMRRGDVGLTMLINFFLHCCTVWYKKRLRLQSFLVPLSSSSTLKAAIIIPSLRWQPTDQPQTYEDTYLHAETTYLLLNKSYLLWHVWDGVCRAWNGMCLWKIIIICDIVQPLIFRKVVQGRWLTSSASSGRSGGGWMVMMCNCKKCCGEIIVIRFECDRPEVD